MKESKIVLILGANSDVAKECFKLYVEMGFHVITASRNLESIEDFASENQIKRENFSTIYFDAVDFKSHQIFYNSLSIKPQIVLYAAGYLEKNIGAMQNFEMAKQMMMVNYMGAVSILNIIAADKMNLNLERIIGLSSLSGVRGRKSNFIYGSTKSAFTQYLAGLRQFLKDRKITVNVFVIGYIETKMNAGLDLNKNLIMNPKFVAKSIVNVGNSFKNTPDLKWKIIHFILKIMPESLVANLP